MARVLILGGGLGALEPRHLVVAAATGISRRGRVVLDWTVGLFFRRDISQLGGLQAAEPARKQVSA